MKKRGSLNGKPSLEGFIKFLKRVFKEIDQNGALLGGEPEDSIPMWKKNFPLLNLSPRKLQAKCKDILEELEWNLKIDPEDVYQASEEVAKDIRKVLPHLEELLKRDKQASFRRKVIARLIRADEIGDLDGLLLDESEELWGLREELKKTTDPREEKIIRRNMSVRLVNLTSAMIRFSKNPLSRTPRGKRILQNMKKVLDGYKFY